MSSTPLPRDPAPRPSPDSQPFTNKLAANGKSHAPASASSGSQEGSPEDAKDDDTPETRSFDVIVVGGGEAGNAVLEALRDEAAEATMAVIEPSQFRYEPWDWVRVGTEGRPKESTRSRRRLQIPPGVVWVRDQMSQIHPEEQRLATETGFELAYEVLVLATGIEMKWNRIRGLEDHLGEAGICSVYGYEQAENAWELFTSFEGGRALFTAPSSPYKGAGTPLDVLHRVEDLWRDRGVREQIELYFTTAATEEYAGPEYRKRVQRDAEAEQIHVYVGYELLEVRPERQEAVFSVAKDKAQSRDVLPYDLLHVVPPMRPPDVIESSPLAYQVGPLKGFLEVIPETLQHRHHTNIFGVGDVVGVEAEKTGERARRQAAEVAPRIRERLQSG